MMQCRDIEELMVDFLYQELEEPQAKAFEEHVHGCARCEAELSSLARTRQALRAMPQAEPSPAVSARLLHEAARRAPKGDEERGGIFAWLKDFFAPLARQPAWVGAAASVLVVAGLASVLTLRKHNAVPAAAEVATKAEPAATAVKAEGDSEGGEKAKERGRQLERFDQPVVAAAPPAEAKPHDALAEKSAKPRPMKKALPSDDESRTELAGPKQFQTDRTGRTTTPREEDAVRAATADKNAEHSAYKKAEDSYRKDAVGAKGGDLDRGQTVSGELKMADPAKSGKADQAPPATDRPTPTQEGQRGPETRDSKEAPLAKGGNLGGAAAPSNDRRAGGAPAGTIAAEPSSPPAPSKAPQRGSSEVQAPAANATQEREREAPNQKSSLAANQAPKQLEQQKQAPAKPSPPSQSVELHQQARKQASSGACPEAMALRDKISRIDPGYFNKNVAGDPAFRGCIDQQRAKAKRPAPAEAAPRLNDNADAAEKNDSKAAH